MRQTPLVYPNHMFSNDYYLLVTMASFSKVAMINFKIIESMFLKLICIALFHFIKLSHSLYKLHLCKLFKSNCINYISLTKPISQFIPEKFILIRLNEIILDILLIIAPFIITIEFLGTLYSVFCSHFFVIGK